MDKLPYVNTVNWFRKLSKNDDPSVALSYCLTAVRTLSSQLRSKNTVVDREPSLCFLAAVMAYRKYSLTDEFSDFSRIRAGEVTLETSEDENSKNIDALFRTAYDEARPYLKSGVIFKSCKGGGGDAGY